MIAVKISFCRLVASSQATDAHEHAAAESFSHAKCPSLLQGGPNKVANFENLLQHTVSLKPFKIK